MYSKFMCKLHIMINNNFITALTTIIINKTNQSEMNVVAKSFN